MTDLKTKYREMCELYAATYTREELNRMARGADDATTLQEIYSRGAQTLDEDELFGMGFKNWEGWYAAWNDRIEHILRKHYDSA